MCLAHIPIAYLDKVSAALSTLHVAAVLGLSMVAVVRSRRPAVAVAAIGYICGAEVLWRGTGAHSFWETGKYSSLLIAALVVVVASRSWKGAQMTGGVYALLMLPSITILPYFDRSEVAFNISGPIALGGLTLVFSGITLSLGELRTALATTLAPIVGLVALAASSTFAVADPTELVAGGKATTAGIGPNQVSAILGLGMLACLALGLLVRRRLTRVSLGVFALWLSAQALLSLSRGGFWGALGAIVGGAFFLLRDRRRRGQLIVGVVLVGTLFQFLVFPAIDSFTGGIVSARFSDAHSTGRIDIARADLEIFQENPAFGIGPGQSYKEHARTFRASSAHTEYSRLLSEHGSFGLAALVLMVLMSLTAIAKCRSDFERACTIAFLLWAGLFMGHSAMRLAAPAFMFALAATRLDPQSVRLWRPAPLSRRVSRKRAPVLQTSARVSSVG
ncbi:MAG: O-antigen ligase family protein [Thermoanaerobaculia bacterium]|nr:O-antigen ligase family protein [Thermoanaerobaculia bacterium]